MQPLIWAHKAMIRLASTQATGGMGRRAALAARHLERHLRPLQAAAADNQVGRIQLFRHAMCRTSAPPPLPLPAATAACLPACALASPAPSLPSAYTLLPAACLQVASSSSEADHELVVSLSDFSQGKVSHSGLAH